MQWRVPMLLAVWLLIIGCAQAIVPTLPTTPAQAPTATPSPGLTPTLPTAQTPTATPPSRATELGGSTATPTSSPQALQAQVLFKGVAFEVELAVTPEERSQGLMHRQSLGEKQGMLFIYQRDNSPGFWMKNMFIPLDIFWIDAKGTVVGVAANVPPHQGNDPPPVYRPPSPIRYVLELNAGTAKRYGIKPDSKATLIGLPPA